MAHELVGAPELGGEAGRSLLGVGGCVARARDIPASRLELLVHVGSAPLHVHEVRLTRLTSAIGNESIDCAKHNRVV